MAIRTSNNHTKGYFERLNYHFGQMMTERDFRDQQSYYNEKRWMMNRFGFGWGVMHGLKVHLNTDNCLSRRDLAPDLPFIGISEGFALDKYGNEILVPSHREYNLDYLLKSCKKNDSDGYLNEILNLDKITKLYIAIRYSECGTEPFQVPELHCCDAEQECTFGRTREGFEFIASVTGWPDHDSGSACDNYDGDIDCFHDLRNPKVRIINDRPQKISCEPVPLATISYENGQWVVDNSTVRPIAYSTYRLGELIDCLTSELWKVHAAGYDRRGFVPLLSQTIPGCRYRDGKTLLLDNVGKTPFRITTDGNIIWCTDKELPVVHCIPAHPAAHKPNHYPVTLQSKRPGWGIAYDGHFVWITIPQRNALEKINVCTRKSAVITDEQFSNPQEIVFDGKYLWISHGPENNGTQHQDHHEHNERHEHNEHNEHYDEMPSWKSDGEHSHHQSGKEGDQNAGRNDDYDYSEEVSWGSEGKHPHRPHAVNRDNQESHDDEESLDGPSWESDGKRHYTDERNNRNEHRKKKNLEHSENSSGDSDRDSDDAFYHPHNEHGMNEEKSGQIIITRYNASTGEIKQIVLTDEGQYSPVNGMTFDGESIWVTYDDFNGNAIVQKVDDSPKNCKEEHNRQEHHEGAHHKGAGWHDDDRPGKKPEQINLRKQYGKDIAFDGNAIWVSHNEGLSKIDIARCEEVGNTSDRGRLSAIAFDGKAMWTVQNRGSEAEMRRYDLYTPGSCGSYELSEKHADIHLGRFCFDGSYLWITGQKTTRHGDEHKNYDKSEEHTSERGKTICKGIIYRVLP
jgi:hypothetical protein